MSNPVPNLPPTSGVQDLAVRSFLDALAQAWTVRNGQTRVTDERFLTVKDLTDGINLFKNGGGGGALTGDAAPSASANAIAVTLADLSAEIMQSRLYRWLGERISRIQYMNRPDWLPPGNAAMVKEEITELVDDYHAIARKVTTAAAEFNGNLALARQELTALATANEATAQSVTKLQTNVKDNFALVNKTLESHTTAISAQASEVTTLQADIGASKLTADQAFKLAQDIEGNLEGTWGVKFDANGYVAGFGMALDGTTTAPTSMFGVRADKFFIGPPATTGTNGQSGAITVNQMDADTVDRYALPFVVTTSNWTAPSTGKTYGPGVWINTARIATAHIDSAHIANAAITSAKIGDAQVGTLKLAGNAVTVPLYAEAATNTDHNANSAPVFACSVSGSFTSNCPVFVIVTVTAQNNGSSTNALLRFELDGVGIAERAFSLTGGWTNSIATTFKVDVTGNPTTPINHTFTLKLGNNWGSGGPWRDNFLSIMVIGCQR